jgi:hypothetical protein
MGEDSNAWFGLGSLRERGHLVDLGVHGSILLKSVIKEIGWDGVDWIVRVQGGNRNNFRTLIVFKC